MFKIKTNQNFRVFNPDTNKLDPIPATEFNSSTDTYTSENGTEAISKEMSDSLNQNSFERNFEIGDATVGKPIKIDNDEFSFIQIRSPNSSEKKLALSPSKSALKDPSKASPKKNVVFTSNIAEVIRYTENETSVDEEEKQRIDAQFSNEVEETLNHNWKQVRQTSLSSDDTPPPLPPHSVNSEVYDDSDKQTLKEFKLHLKNLDNISLNEKLELYLNNQPDTHREMDQHLQDLQAQKQVDLQNNIQHLSLDLQNKLTTPVENPLNSLYKSTEVPLRSAGSSQSSLQSLMDSNRMLPNTTEQHSKSAGVQLNDGIHGFSNEVVEQLIPTAETAHSDESQMLSFNIHRRLSSDNEEFHDSFDNDYNNTEQSIMDLLTSASKSQEQLVEPEKNPIVKEEPQEYSVIDSQIKSSPSMKQAEIQRQLHKEPVPSTLKQEIEPDVQSEEEKESEPQFRIADHIDEDWKFEDSLDADREDNDDITNGDLTLISHSQADHPFEDAMKHDSDSEEIDSEDLLNTSSPKFPLPIKTEALEVNLSPDTDASLDDSPDRRSLAPPRSTDHSLQNSPVRSLMSRDPKSPTGVPKVLKYELPRKETKTIDVAIDATTPPTPIRLAREAKLKQKYGSTSPAPPLPTLSNSPFIDSKTDHKLEVKREVEIESLGKADTLEPTVSKEIAIANPAIESVNSQTSLYKDSVESLRKSVGTQKSIESKSIESKSIESNEAIEEPAPKDLKQSTSLEESISGVSERPIESPKPVAFTEEEDLVQEDQPEFSDAPELPTSMSVPNAVNVAVDTPELAPIPNDVVDISEEEIENKDEVDNDTFNTSDSSNKFGDEILANSTNVAPPEELTLPPIEANNYSSFEEITKTLNNSRDVDEDSFEQSLSAEFDEEKPSKATSYISIWHSQTKRPPRHQERKSKSLDAINISVYDPASNTFKIPSGLLNKKIKEVNVMSRKVVDPNEIDYNEDFLPELSQDSGFESHFNNLVNTSNNESLANTSGNRLSQTPLSERNILVNKNNQSDDSVEKPVPKHYSSLQPQVLPKKPITEISQKRSRFKVPSFEIKKSINQMAETGNSDKYKYNDIFNDTTEINEIQQPPTIKGHGMKTLPSMDKDDVKKIMNTKRMISQEEYSQLKLVGQKSSVVNDSEASKHNDLQQQASIHNADTSFESGAALIDNDAMSHLAGELMKNPRALLSKEQVFNESDIMSSKAPSSPKSSRMSSVIHTDYNAHQIFPDPDPELIKSPAGGIFKTPPKDFDNAAYDEVSAMDSKQTASDLEVDKNKENNPPTPKPSGPIKIGSPIKLIKKGSTTSVVIQSPSKKKSPTSQQKVLQPINNDMLQDLQKESPKPLLEPVETQFKGTEIANNKLRAKEDKGQEPIKIREPSQGIEQHEKKLSVVSVPSMYTNLTEHSHTSSHTLLNQNKDHTWKQHSIQSSVMREQPETLPMERGRLFFRVVGLKNISLPDIAEHKGEFSVTLDNGVHCIKTPTYKLEDASVLIGKEFELTVGESLEFILTMKMSYIKPKGGYTEVTERKLVKSKSKLGRLFGSKNVVTQTKFVPQDAVDTWEGKFAQDGSFGRCYIDLEQYEDKITYKTNGFDIPVFNEWETIKTRKETINAKPYVIGKLEVKMLFIPRTELHESLPTSIRSCEEVLQQLSLENTIEYEGYMSQDGGDCDGLKRRFFKIQGTSLIAHSEFSHKTRAKINLRKIVDIIYVDNQKPETAKKARNFSDVLLVPESFKIKFANGEIIDFEAPNQNEKYKWINIFETIVQHNKFRRLPWVKSMTESTNKTNNPWYNPETNGFA